MKNVNEDNFYIAIRFELENMDLPPTPKPGGAEVLSPQAWGGKKREAKLHRFIAVG